MQQPSVIRTGLGGKYWIEHDTCQSVFRFVKVRSDVSPHSGRFVARDPDGGQPLEWARPNPRCLWHCASGSGGMGNVVERARRHYRTAEEMEVRRRAAFSTYNDVSKIPFTRGGIVVASRLSFKFDRVLSGLLNTFTKHHATAPQLLPTSTS